jgi:hypothetical protein
MDIISTRWRWFARSRRRKALALVSTVTFGATALVVTLAGANPALVAGFEIDAKLQVQVSNTEDWADGPGGQGVINDNGAVAGNLAASRTAICAANTGTNPLLICDPVKTDSTTFPGGAKESDPAGWVPIQTSQVTPKTDITNVYAYGKSPVGHPTILNGMERLPKAGDLHLDFEYNKLMTGTAPNQIPQRQANDILVAYDLGGGRNSNSDAITVRVFKAKKLDPACVSNCAGEYDYENPDTTLSGTGSLSGSGVTAQINGASISCGKWGCYDDGYNLTNTLPAFSFAEAGIDLNTSVGLSSACFNWVTVKSRSSESVTSQLKDTTGPKSFPFCGGMTVHKYNDLNQDGDKDSTDTDGSGWSFTVNGPAANGGIGPQVCAGTTGSNGNLSCTTGSLSDLAPGTYRVTETQKAGFLNTEPGSGDTSVPIDIINDAGTVSRDVVIGVGSNPTVEFGNACKTGVTFTINNVPSSVSAVHVVYSSSGHTNVSNVDITLTKNGSSYSNTTPIPLTFNDSLTWSWYINSDSANALTGGTNVDLGGCSSAQSASFNLATLSGFKYKDANNDGDFNTGDLVGHGFTFQLKQGTTVLQTTTSDQSGNYSFSQVAPGTYTVHEVSETGWVQTEPAAGADRTVTVVLGDTNKTIGDFGNTPLSDITVTFGNRAVTPGTGLPATEAAISCTPTVGTQSGNSVTSTGGSGLPVGTYDCRVVITDP